MLGRKGTVEERRRERLMQYKSVKRWMRDVASSGTGSEHTERYYLRSLDYYIEFTGKDPDTLIEERKEEIGSKVEFPPSEDMVKDFFLELAEEKERTTAALYQAAIKSFYESNKAALDVKTPSAISKKIHPVTMDELRELDRAADAREGFFIRFLKDSGMSRRDALEMVYGDIKEEFEKGNQFIHLDVIRRKENVRYETYIGSNTVEALKTYLKERRNRGEQITEDTPLFASKQGKKIRPVTLTTILYRLGKRLSIDLSPHRLRKFFETYLALTVRHPVILKYWMGHSLSGDVEARYVIPPEPEQRKLYMEGYEKIDLTPKAISREELRKEFFEMLPDETLKPLADKHGITVQELRTVMREKKKTPPELTPEDVAEIKRKTGKRTETNGAGVNCQRIVSESELPMLLADGWEAKIVLPSGKIVVERA